MHDQAPQSPTSAPAETKSPARPSGDRTPWIPESKLPPLPENSINSHVRKILLRSPMFPRFYADMVISSAPNSHEAKILAANYQKIIDRINMPNSKSCTHIKVTGIRCGSPALRGEQFCYFHQHAHRGVRKPAQSRLHPVAILEDEESIQSSLMEVVNGLIRNTIDLKRAELILRALHIAVKNARRVKFAFGATDMVKEVPDYPEPPATEPERAAQSNIGTTEATPEPSRNGSPNWTDSLDSRIAEPPAETESDLPAVAATPPKPLHPDPTFWERWEAGGKELARRVSEARAAKVTTANVGTEAFLRPGGEAAVSSADPGKTKPQVSNADPGKKKPPASNVDPRAKKPPVSVKEVAKNAKEAVNARISVRGTTNERMSVKQAPKERKIAAHRASGG